MLPTKVDTAIQHRDPTKIPLDLELEAQVGRVTQVVNMEAVIPEFLTTMFPTTGASRAHVVQVGYQSSREFLLTP